MRTTLLDWDHMVTDLESFAVLHRHGNPSRTVVADDGHPLGEWLRAQRRIFRAGRLNPERQSRLLHLGVILLPADRDSALRALRAFRAEHGHVDVPRGHIASDGFLLGTWVRSRRSEYFRDPTRTLHRWPELTEFGFRWLIRDRDAAWQHGVAELADYVADHGDAAVPRRWETEDGFHLGVWIGRRRTDYKTGQISEERIAELDELGMLWQTRRSPRDSQSRQLRDDTVFTTKLKFFENWVRSNPGLAATRFVVTDDGFKVGEWLSYQRRQGRSGSLAPDRRAALSRIDPDWDRPRSS
jgi:hypothetical protein